MSSSDIHAPIPIRPLIPLITERTSASPRPSPSRLLSPIRLANRRSFPFTNSSSPAPSCSPIKRRRGFHPPPARLHNRQRHCLQTDCCIAMSGGPAIFDQLPWISAMETRPPSINHWDLVDLSQLPVNERRPASPGAGPIRRRKTSLRSAPFPADNSGSPELSPSLSVIDSSESLCLPLLYQSPITTDDSVPTTPPRRPDLLPDNVYFRNLMPVTPPPIDIEG